MFFFMHTTKVPADVFWRTHIDDTRDGFPPIFDVVLRTSKFEIVDVDH